MLNELKQLQKSQKNVCIYTNPDNSALFIFGKIIYVNDTHIIAYLISPDGEFDGILTKETDSIIRLETDGQYSDMMAYLTADSQLPEINIDIIDNSAILSVLKYAQETKNIAALELTYSGYEDVVGFVESASPDICRIQQIDKYGEKDGISIIPAKNITQVCINSADEKRRLRLYNKKN